MCIIFKTIFANIKLYLRAPFCLRMINESSRDKLVSVYFENKYIQGLNKRLNQVLSSKNIPISGFEQFAWMEKDNIYNIGQCQMLYL